MKLKIRPPRLATVLAIAALIVATSGTTYAISKVTGADIVDGTVTSADVADNSLTGADIANGSLTTEDLTGGGASGPITVFSAITVGFTSDSCSAGTYRVRVVRSWGDTSTITIGPDCFAPTAVPVAGQTGYYLYAPFDPLTGKDLSQFRLSLGGSSNGLGTTSLDRPPSGSSAAQIVTPSTTTLPAVGIPKPLPGWGVLLQAPALNTPLVPANILATESNINQFDFLGTPNP